MAIDFYDGTTPAMSRCEVGSVFNRLRVSGRAFKTGSRRMVVCECECGNFTALDTSSLIRGVVQSCGCLHRENAAKQLSERRATHRETATPLYVVWSSMKSRCLNPNNDAFANYGGREIHVCDEWNQSFETFRDWAISNGYQQELEIDRRNNDGNYEPDNCRFVTPKVNSRNRRSSRLVTAFGETKTLSEWIDDQRCVVSCSTLRFRLDRSRLPAEVAISRPAVLGKNQYPVGRLV